VDDVFAHPSRIFPGVPRMLARTLSLRPGGGGGDPCRRAHPVLDSPWRATIVAPWPIWTTCCNVRAGPLR
jgi:hypothetical protein